MSEDWRYADWEDPTDEERSMWANVPHDLRDGMLRVTRSVLREAQDGVEPSAPRVLQLAMFCNAATVRQAVENYEAVVAEHVGTSAWRASSRRHPWGTRTPSWMASPSTRADHRAGARAAGGGGHAGGEVDSPPQTGGGGVDGAADRPNSRDVGAALREGAALARPVGETRGIGDHVEAMMQEARERAPEA